MAQSWRRFVIIAGILGLLLISLQGLFSQHEGFRYIKNYSDKEYGKSPQNWCILQDKRGVIYVGNQSGLLEFDGVSWRAIKVENKVVRSMAMDDAGTIYIGGHNEFGFLAPDTHGAPVYTSLKPFIETEKYIEFSNVWKTYSTEKGIYFQAGEFLFRWEPKTRRMKTWEPEERFYFSFVCGETFFIRQKKLGLMQLVNDSLEPIRGDETFAEKIIYMMAPYDAQRVLIGTKTHGLYCYDGKNTAPFSTEADDVLKAKQLYGGVRLSSGDFALATSLGGLLIMDAGGKLKEAFTRISGLPDDDVKCVYEDFHGNLWLGLENWISNIEYNSPVSLYDRQANLSGLALSVVKHQGDLYAGTTKGLYTLVSPGKFRLVPGVPGNCWSLLSVGGSLLAATDGGVFQVRDNKKRRVAKGASYVLLRSRMDTNRIWVGADSGPVSLVLNANRGDQNGQWTVEHHFKNITPPIRTIAEDLKGNLWLGTQAMGVIRMVFPGNEITDQPVVSRYDTSCDLPKGEISVIVAVNHVMLATRKGMFRFDEHTETFIPDATLGEEFTGGPEKRSVFRIAEDRQKNIWFYSSRRNYMAAPQDGGTYIVDFKPLPISMQINGIYPDLDEESTWLAGQGGLIRYDRTVKKDNKPVFSTLLRGVRVNGELIFNGYTYETDNNSQARLKGPTPIFTHRERNFRFQFAAPFFEGDSMTRYRYFLEGYDAGWSDRTSETQKDYTNLSPGLYSFRAKAENMYDDSSTEAVFQFKILPPWYKTWWALSFYTIVFFMLLFYVIKWRSGKLEREKQRLEKVVKKRTKEIIDKNQQLEQQTLQLKEQSGRLEEMDKAKSRFFANISHEFRTPLTLIMGPLEQMLSNGHDGKQEKKLSMMLRNSQRLLSLINQLLELAKFDSGTIVLHAGRYNIIPYLKGIMASFEPVAAQNDVDLVFHAGNGDDAEDITLYFDPEKLEEVMVNLLSNSVKFTPPGGRITLTVSRNPAAEENFSSGSLDISISDTGPGIPREQLSRIFDRFFQSDATSEHHRKGSGIGLAIAKEMIELHRGRINVHSREGKGTEFIIRLPLGKEHLEPAPAVPVDAKAVPVDAKTAPVDGKLGVSADLAAGLAAEIMDEARPGNDGGAPAADTAFQDVEKELILVVDDSADVREYVRDSLEPSYRVLEAADGKEGVETALEHIPDLIISDVMMPGMDGHALCRQLKNDAHTSHIPVILLTAKASEENIIAGLDTGADDYITKPFNTKMLNSRIKNLIELRRHMQRKMQREMKLQPVNAPVSSMDKTFIKHLKKVINENMSDPEFNIEQLCKKMNMSQPSLYRKIHALSGESPTEFIRSWRLKRGAELLKDNFGSVLEVAFEVGFSSANYFTKCFKKKFHQLPSVFQASENEG